MSIQTRQTWLITGGAGFIGSNFVRRTLELHPDVLLVDLDKLTYAGRRENLPEDPRHVLVEGDIASRTDVESVFEIYSPRRIVNFAAESHVDRSIDGPRAFIETNIGGTFELLEAARRQYADLAPNEASQFRFLHVSTDEVYGSLGREGYFTEETAYAPNSPYSASKAGADMLVRAYHHTYGLPTLTTNCSNNYGPYQLPEKLIPLVLLNCLEGKSLPIYGDGSNVRDWIYVEDHCDGILRALEAGDPGEQYAFGGNSERSNLQVVDGICDALEKLRPAAENAALGAQGIENYRDLKTFVKDRPGHDQRYAIDATKAAKTLGWSPRHDFESGLERTVEWYLTNEDWRLAVQSGADVRSRRGLSESKSLTSADHGAQASNEDH
jgi:dTDP-glucose 4,6-dehydratase